MKITCPGCGVKGSVDDSYRGKTIRCPKCKEQFVAQDVFSAESEDKPVAKESVTKDEVVEHKVDVEQSQDVEVADETSDRPAGSQPQEPPVTGEAVEVPEPAATPEKSEQNEAETVTEQVVEATAEDEPPKQTETTTPPPVPPIGPQLENQSYQAASQEAELDFDLQRMMSDAWEKSKGAKGVLWGGLLAMYGVLLLVTLVTASFAAFLGEGGFIAFVLEFATSVLSAVLTGGLMCMGVKRAIGKRIHWKDVFKGFDVAGPAFTAATLQLLLVFVGTMLLVLPGVYLLVGYTLAMPLVICKKMPAWEALETSRKAVHKIWWKVFGLFLIVTIIAMISAIPFGIGLIWTLPFSIILIGELYRVVFPENE